MAGFPGNEKWLKDIAALRRNPSTFFAHNDTKEDDFLLDILQALFSEDLSMHVKVMLLGILQEQTSVLLSYADSVEQVVGSLTNVYQQLHLDTAAFFKGQLLVAITTIMLDCNQLEEHPRNFLQFVDILLDVVSKVNGSKDRVLRGNACECLKEIETIHPGLLSRKVDHFYAMCQLENSCICQSYMTLFGMVLKNGLEQLLEDPNSLNANDLSDLLSRRKEPLKPLNLPDHFNIKMFQLKEKITTPPGQLPMHLDTRELKRALTYLVDHLPIMTQSSVMQASLLVGQCLTHSPSINPLIFKGHVSNWASSADMVLFHLVLLLKAQFPTELLNGDEECVVLSKLLTCANHPALTPGHRLLAFQWLQHFPEREPIFPHWKPHLPGCLFTEHYTNFFPTMFDGLDTSLVKLNLLSQCYVPSTIHDTSSATLMGCIDLLGKSLEYGIVGRPATSWYRLLFSMLQRHYGTVLREEIMNAVVKVTVKNPKYTPHTVNFIESMQKVTSDKSFTVLLLETLLQHVVTSDIHNKEADLEDYLLILQRAAQETEISPKPILDYLQMLLLRTSLMQDGSWFLGNKILSVCHQLLQVHSKAGIYSDMGDTLYTLFTGHQDIEIRDRACLYYALLTNLSSEKISQILSSVGSAEDSQNLTRLVTGSASVKQAGAVETLEHSVLKLTRIRKQTSSHRISRDGSSSVAKYYEALQSLASESTIYIEYYLHFDESFLENIPDAMRHLYAVILHIDTPSAYHSIEDITVASLSVENSSEPTDGCQMVTIALNPKEPLPTSLPLSAMFSSSDGRTCVCQLEPVEVTFDDLFIPIPIMPSLHPVLFNELWDSIKRDEQTRQESMSAESICTVALGSQTIHRIVAAELADYIVMSDEVQDGQSINLAMLLPPKWHLLLRLQLQENITVVSMVTDNWKMLPLVNQYLLSLEDH
ncbi:AP-5 complex subunit beta-1 isoform X1 [Strongylocentrotus purpuratus]|uniref:AP-5 complex subunit beta-1 n=1 Tax=Strongylocentrotus purpuratus TaxID=7668 RepID=A0A7M7LTZ7_STRPU|nr:AP-5 complex subunit beta-1 isoform X1 [Strongylocentrotus purpuratus]